MHTHVEIHILYINLNKFPVFIRGTTLHLHECSPFWVGIFITFNKENYCVDMRILIDKAFLYVIGKSYIMETWKNGVFNIKGKHNFKHCYYSHV